MLPRLDVELSAGAGALVESEDVESFFAMHAAYLREIGVNPAFATTIRVRGRSMMPTLADRDWVIVDTSIDSVVDEGLYAVVYGGLSLIKRIRLMRDGTVKLSSDNRDEGYDDEVIPPSELPELRIAGRVRGHLRGI
ncbi:putative phage repressor [Aurantimonas sp. 22II-16-19i]|nr:putative phage repressor [Aurantimonas sp. 22II-16-19i]